MLQNASAGPFPGPIDVKKASENIHLLNCRFIREYTKGVEDQWTINGFNYIKVADLMREVEQGKMWRKSIWSDLRANVDTSINSLVLMEDWKRL